MKRRSIAWILSCAVLASSFPQGTFESSAASVVEVETETQESTVQGSAAPIVIEGSEIANAELDSANNSMSTKQIESITETAEPLMTETIETPAAEIPVPESAPVTENTVPETTPAQIPETNAPEIVITPSTESEVPETSAPVIITETPTVESEGAAAVPETPAAETSAAETESPVVITEHPDPQSTESDSVPAEETTVQEPSGEDGIIVLDGEEVQAEPSVSAFTAEIEQPWIYEKIQYGHLDDMGISLTLAYSDGTMEQWVYEEEETGYSQETNLSFYKAEDPSVLIPEEALTAGEYQMSISFRDQECIVPVQVKSLAEIPDVLSEGETVVSEGYYQFAAGESGAYSFASADGSFLVMSEDGVELMASENGYVLDAGEDYYFRLEALEDGDLDVSFEIQRIPGESEEVVVEEAEEVAELLEADAAGEILLGEEKEIASGEYYRFTPAEDGWYEIVGTGGNGGYAPYHFYDEFMNPLYSMGRLESSYSKLQAGSQYYVGWNQWESGDYTGTAFIKKLDSSNITEGQTTVSFAENETKIFTFVPERDGFYKIDWNGNAGGLGGFSWENGGGYGNIAQLTAGEIYHILVVSESAGDWVITLNEAPMPVGMELLSEPIIAAGVENSNMACANLVFKIDYSDGSSEELRLGSYTLNGSYFSSTLYDAENGSYVYGAAIEGASYKLICMVDYQSWEFEVTAKKPDEVFTEEILLDQEKEIEEGNYYSFSPVENGWYMVSATLSGGGSAYLCNDSLDEISYIATDSAHKYYELQAGTQYFVGYNSQGNEKRITVLLDQISVEELAGGENTIIFSEQGTRLFSFTPEQDGYYQMTSNWNGYVQGFFRNNVNLGYPVQLKAGVKYTVLANVYEACEGMLSIKKIQEPAKLELLSEPFVLAGIYNNLSNLQFRLTYEDGSSEEIYPYEYISSGSYFTPSLYDPETESYVYEPIEGKSYELLCNVDGKQWEFEVTAKKPEEIFNEEIGLSQETEIKEASYYKFIPTEDGYYILQGALSPENDQWINFYDSSLGQINGITMWDSAELYIKLQAENTYFIKYDSNGQEPTRTVRLEKAVLVEVREGVNTVEFSGNEQKFCRFVPEHDGYFSIFSDSVSVAGFYQGNDSIGYPCHLTEGETYVLFLNSWGEGECSFTIKEVPVLNKMELVGEPVILAGLESNYSYLTFRLIYEDGSSEEVHPYDTTMSGSSLSPSLYDVETGNYVYTPIEGTAYKLVCYLNGKQWEFEVTARKATDVFKEELVLGQEQELNSNDYYQFRPNESGIYYIENVGRLDNADIAFYDDQLNWLYSITGSVNGYDWYIPMEAGQVYFLRFTNWSNPDNKIKIMPEKVATLPKGEEKNLEVGQTAFELTGIENGNYQFIFEGSGSLCLMNLSTGDNSWLYGGSQNVQLNADSRYLLEGDIQESGRFTYRQIPDITDIQLEEYTGQTEFLESYDSVYISGLTANITYSDGTSQQVTFDGTYASDTYGNSFSFRYYPEDTYLKGDYDVWYDSSYDLTAGTYYMALEGYESNAVKIQILSLQEFAEKNFVKLDEPYLFAGGSNYCAFVFDPETSGSYEFTFRPGGIGSLRVYDSEMQNVFSGSSQHEYQVSLKAGERYYGLFMRTNWNAEIQMTVSALAGLREIDVRTEQKEFIAGLEYVTPGAIEVETIYEDGRKGIVNGRNQDFRGNSFDYELEGNNGTQELGSSLSIGTYTITASAKSDAEIQDTTEIRAVALETASLPLVEENQDVTMELTELKFTLARFVPRSNGEYQAVLWEDEDTKRSVEFYRQTSEGLEAVEELTAGDVYIFVVPESRNDSYSSVQFRLVKKTETEEPEEPDTPDIPEGWETSKGGELTLDQPQEVTIVSSQESTVEYTFTPEESGLYLFESSVIDGIGSDPRVELYNEYWDYLAYADDSDESLQFSLTYKLEAGHTYTYSVDCYDSYTRFMVQLTKIPEIPLSSVRFVPGLEEYVEIFDFSESVGNNNYFWGNFELSYANGEIKEKRVDIYGDESVFTDDFGNEIRHSYQFLEETEDTYVYRITVSCGDLQSTTDVTVRKLESLDAKPLQLDERYETEFQGEADRSGDGYVTFTPEKTGSYYIIKEELESPGDEFVATQVVSSSEVIGGGSYFEMTAGETYYIRLSFRNGFRFAVTISEVKEVSGVEFLSDHAEISLKDYYLDIAKTQIRVNYSDGSHWDQEISAGDWIVDLYGNEVAIESRLEGANSVRLTALVYPYAEDGGYYWDSKLFTLSDDISTLNVGEPVSLTNSDDTYKDIVRIVPEKTGVYAFTYQGEGYLDAYALYNGTHRKVLSYRNSWTLEAGTEYLLEVQISEGSSSDTIRLVSRNIHTMEDTWHTLLAATCTSEGQEYRKCTDEGCSYTEVRTVQALGHQFGEEIREEATATETGRVYQVCSRCGLEKVLEILPITSEEVQNVIDQIGALEDSAGVDEIVEAVQNVNSIDNKTLENGGASDAIAVLEEKVVQNDIAGATVTEGAIESTAEGAALSVVAYQDQITDGKTGAAKISVEESANEYENEEVFANRKLFVMDIQLSIVNAEDSSEIFAEDIQPSTPIQMTVSIPEEFQGKEFELYHVSDTGELERIYYQSPDGKTMIFTVSALSDFVLRMTDCNGEHQYIEQVEKQPTCVEEGLSKLICSACGDETTKVLLATGIHSWTTKVDQAATCGAEGSQHRECTVCGFQETATVIPATGAHSWITKVDQAATCGAEGSQHEECTVCGTKGAAETIPTTGNHSWTTKVDQAATCGASGSQHKECTVCGTKGAAETIPATGNHSWTTKVDQAATCGASGSQHKECTVCGTKGETETIPATGNHSWTTKVDQAATCGAAGSQHKECSVCGAKGAEETIPATGAHSYKEIISKEATCGEDGRKFEQCTVCGAQKAAQTIPATGKHQYGSYQVTKEATVLAAGTKTRTCSVCGDKDMETVQKLRATIKVNVKSIPLKVRQSTTAVKVTYGKGDKITSWRSSNKKVATVTSKGKITGKKAGKAVITVKLKSGKTAKITVKVQKTTVKTTKLKLNKKSLTLRKGKKYQLTATVTPITSSEKVKYKSSNKKVLTVTSKGKITAKKKGTAYVIVTSGKKTVRCKVKVR